MLNKSPGARVFMLSASEYPGKCSLFPIMALWVPAKVMAECVNKIEEVDMWNTSLNTQQVEQMLLLAKRKTNLKSLNISGNYFAMLDVPKADIEDAKLKIPIFEYC